MYNYKEEIQNLIDQDDFDDVPKKKRSTDTGFLDIFVSSVIITGIIGVGLWFVRKFFKK